MRHTSFAFLSLFLVLTTGSISAQTLPVGTPVLEETWRRMQLSGNRDMNTSFSVRPIYMADQADFDSIYYPQGSFNGTRQGIRYAKGKGILRLLPITLNQQYNTHHPYGWNDGSMIQARGYQAQLTAGLYSRLGPLSVQLQPELVYAQNRDFPTFPSSYSDDIWNSYYYLLNRIDNPEKYGNGSYTKLLPGQSSIKLNFKKLAIGVSTENLWWGPGVRNSLLMSNNAPGFEHLTFNTTAPLLSGIGSFEWQVVSGFLRGSGILPPDTGRLFNGVRLYEPKPEEKRYINGMIITWQPKWTKGLYLGFTRAFSQYKSDVEHTVDGYLPIIGSLFKGSAENEDAKRRDQMLSVFLRLVLPNDKAEVYAEFGRNDHSQNGRDLMVEPEHARAYIIGGRKLFPTKKKDTQFELMIEVANLQSSSTLLMRDSPPWYVHYQVTHGYTNRGQVMGAGIGPGGNSQTIGLSWVKNINKLGFTLERVTRNNDFYYEAFAGTRNFGSHWVDMSINAYKNWYHKRFLYSANLSFIRSLNYQWRHEFDADGDPVNRDVNNLHATLSVSYLF